MTHEDAGAPLAAPDHTLALRREATMITWRHTPRRIALAALLAYLGVVSLASRASVLGAQPAPSLSCELPEASVTAMLDARQLAERYPYP